MSEARIMIVEDDPIVGHFMRGTLSNLGYTVYPVVSSGEAAVSLAVEYRPDLILMDVMLEGNLDGIETAVRIRRRARIPVIFVTSLSDDGILERAGLAEPYGYLIKPFDGKDLRSSIEMALYKARMEENLRKAHEKFLIFADASSDWEQWRETDGAFSYVSPACERITGYPREAFQEDPEMLLKITHPLDQDLVGPHLHELSEEPELVQFEFRVLTREGEERWISHCCRSVHDSQGNWIGRRATNRDITTDKQNQEALLRAKVQAEVAHRARSSFLANMSHELRTPLNAVIGFTSWIMDEKGGALNENQKEYLGYVYQSGQHLLGLVNDILDLAKIDAGKVQLELSLVKLSRLLENSLVMIREKANRHRIQIAFDLAKIADMVIPVDERRMKQVMYNLLANAVKFTPDGGRIHLSADMVECGHRCEPRGNGLKDIHRPIPTVAALTGAATSREQCILVRISDTGIGLSPEDLERVFVPFEQVDSTLTRKHQGTGLGLSLTRELVELHGGSIWAESEGIGKGSCFSFLIPVMPTLPPPAEPSA